MSQTPPSSPPKSPLGPLDYRALYLKVLREFEDARDYWASKTMTIMDSDPAAMGLELSVMRTRSRTFGIAADTLTLALDGAKIERDENAGIPSLPDEYGED